MNDESREEVVSVEGLTARLEGTTILKDVSFKVYRGEVLVIMGRSGSGKTVLMKHMIGLFTPVEGRVLINGIDIHAADEATRVRIRQRFGVLFQSGGLLGSMTLSENIFLPLAEHADMPARLKEMLVRMKLGMVRLDGYDDLLPAELSGGMKKRAGLARAMVRDPEILFFDEPSAGLDPVTSAELDRTIVSINEGMGTTMIVVSHELQSILNIAHRVIMLDGEEKGVIAEGDPRELMHSSRDLRVTNFLNRRVG
ncbi:MAG: ATP-binding cassette domain-containing protein [Syntrophales bacterium]|nr:ATP-binding cassette domain-containing protein [Syntrophales bacterium]MCK9527901.1 ATP-binding cassette domain-containing protein [Syntrophales bacterium]MDX9921924.1 ATP-binding cassette domain-containing protein [Syntrophales bacterium]